MSAPQTTAQGAQPSVPPKQLFRALVKHVISGDCLVIRSHVVKDGKNLEKQITLANITAPRLGRRLNPTSPDSTIEPDQPYAFEAREFLRKKLIGKEVCFVKDSSPNTNAERGTLYLGKDPATGENINEAIVAAGLAEVRRLNKPSEEETRLVALEDEAKAHKLGKWSQDAESTHVRDVKYTIDNATNFVDSFRQKPVDAIVEYVRDGSTIRVLLVPSYQTVTVQLSGLKCPGFKREGDSEVAEPFAEEARSFVETRLLQRDVSVRLEGVANQSNGILLGTIIHPNGNISEFLLREGLAKCVDWSMGVVSGGAEKYRAAERHAKQNKLRLWKNYTQQNVIGDEASRQLTGKVVEVLNGDGLVLKLNDNSNKKIFLSSIRPPRQADFKDFPLKAASDRKGSQLYDVPFLFELREFLRKKLIGKKVNCTVDYIQPKSDDYPEKVCCTVMLAETNVAEAVVSQGLAKVIRYKQDDDQRSSKYDDLLAAEARAQKKAVGLHSPKEPTTVRIADASSDANKAKTMLPLLQRAGRLDALVEFVSSGSRFRLYLADRSSILTFLLGGIDCPKLGRPANATAGSSSQPGEEFAEEAFAYSRSRTFQHDVRIECEGVDRGGSFIGQLFLEDGTNLSVALVEQGYAAVHKSAASSPYFAALNAAEQRAKDKKLNRWKNYVEEKVVLEETDKNEPQERVVNHKKIVITEINPSDLHFYAQHVADGAKLEELSEQLRAELDARPPVPGAYTPRVGELCVAKFSQDEQWYRAKVLSVKDSQTTVLYIDYGNRENTPVTRLAQLPAGFDALPAQAHEYALAFVQVSSDEEDVEQAADYFRSLVFDAADNSGEFSVNVEYRVGATAEFVTLYDGANNDVGKKLVAEGYVSVERVRREKRLQKMLGEYTKTLTNAKAAHKMMWRYGDKEQDDAAEFGVNTAAGATRR